MDLELTLVGVRPDSIGDGHREEVGPEHGSVMVDDVSVISPPSRVCQVDSTVDIEYDGIAIPEHLRELQVPLRIDEDVRLGELSRELAVLVRLAVRLASGLRPVIREERELHFLDILERVEGDGGGDPPESVPVHMDRDILRGHVSGVACGEGPVPDGVQDTQAVGIAGLVGTEPVGFDIDLTILDFTQSGHHDRNAGPVERVGIHIVGDSVGDAVVAVGGGRGATGQEAEKRDNRPKKGANGHGLPPHAPV